MEANKLCERPPEYAPAPASWLLTFDLIPWFDSIQIRIIAADSIQDSIRKEISDSQVPSFNLLVMFRLNFMQISGSFS